MKQSVLKNEISEALEDFLKLKEQVKEVHLHQNHVPTNHFINKKKFTCIWISYGLLSFRNSK